MSSTSDETKAQGLPRLVTEPDPDEVVESEPLAGLPPAVALETSAETLGAIASDLGALAAEVSGETDAPSDAAHPSLVDHVDGERVAVDAEPVLDETPEAVVRIALHSEPDDSDGAATAPDATAHDATAHDADDPAHHHPAGRAAATDGADATSTTSAAGDGALADGEPTASGHSRRPLTPAEQLGALVAGSAPATAAPVMPSGVPPTPIAPQPTGPIARPVEPESTAEIMRRPKRPARPLQQPIAVRRNRPRVRKVSRVIRHVDTWSVFKVALVFNLFMLVVLLTAGILLWQVALSTGTIGNVERAFENVGWEVVNLQDKGADIFNNALIAGLFITVGMTGLAVLGATLFNLITDLVGGVRVTVLEEEVQVRQDRQPTPPAQPG